MFDSKLLETLRAMTTGEISEFRDSPYFNDRRVRKEIILLFEYVAEGHPRCVKHELSKESAHRYLFGDKPFVENRLNHIMTALQRLVELYLVAKFSNTFEEAGQLFGLARFYQDRNLPNRFDASTGRLQEMLDNERQVDQDVLWQRYQLEYLRHFHSGLYHQRSIGLNLTPVLDNLDAFYIAQRLILSAGLLSQNQIAQVDTSRTVVIYELMAQQEKYAAFIQSSPLIRAYYELLPLLTHDADLQYVADYRDRVQNMSDFLPKMHLKSLYTAIRNYLAIEYNQGKTEMLPLLFSNLKAEYEQGFLCESNGFFRASTFQSVVTTGLKLQHFEWTRAFMEYCRDRIIGTSQPETVLVFNEANYYFHISEYEAAFKTGFHQLKYDNYVYILAARRLEVMIWFEKNDLNMSEYRLNALKSYLFSNKANIPDQMKLNNDHFVDVLRQLISSRNRINPKRLSALRDKVIRDRKNIAEREWLLEKLKDLLPSDIEL